jgi:hypothetical protein
VFHTAGETVTISGLAIINGYTAGFGGVPLPIWYAT